MADADEMSVVAQTAIFAAAEQVKRMAVRVDSSTFRNAVGQLTEADHIYIVGVGKSLHIGQRMAASFRSVGIAASAIHAVEAMHGDCGGIRRDDVIIAISQSGETIELIDFLEHMNCRAPVIAITGRSDSLVTKAPGVHAVLNAHVDREVDPLHMVPTASALVQAAWGDALMIGIMYQRRFTAERFKDNHPGGEIGRRLRDG